MISLNAGAPLGTVDNLCGKTVVEFRFVADHENTALVFLQRPLEFGLGVHVQMVGGLVQEEHIGLAVNQFAQTHLCLLATA